MTSFLLGWGAVSLFGTLLALRLIRSGKRTDDHSTGAESVADKPVIPRPDAHDIQHRVEH